MVSDVNEETLSLRSAQKMVDNWIMTTGKGYFSELTNMVLLTEEVGELARVMARVYGDQKAKPGDLDSDMAEELADILWVTLCLANQTGVDMEEAFRASLRKKSTRDAKRYL